MKAESAVMPVAPYELTALDNGFAEVEFFENVMKIPAAEKDEAPRFVYDYYRLKVKNRPGLIKDLDGGYGAWLQAAKDQEYAQLIMPSSEELAEAELELKMLELMEAIL